MGCKVQCENMSVSKWVRILYQFAPYNTVHFWRWRPQLVITHTSLWSIWPPSKRLSNFSFIFSSEISTWPGESKNLMNTSHLIHSKNFPVALMTTPTMKIVDPVNSDDSSGECVWNETKHDIITGTVDTSITSKQLLAQHGAHSMSSSAKTYKWARCNRSKTHSGAELYKYHRGLTSTAARMPLLWKI